MRFLRIPKCEVVTKAPKYEEMEKGAFRPADCVYKVGDELLYESYSYDTQFMKYVGHFDELPKGYTPVPGCFYQKSDPSHICTYGEDPVKLLHSQNNKDIKWAVKTSEIYPINIRETHERNDFKISSSIGDLGNCPKLVNLLSTDPACYVDARNSYENTGIYITSKHANDAGLQKELGYMYFIDSKGEGMFVQYTEDLTKTISLPKELSMLHFKDLDSLRSALEKFQLCTPVKGGCLSENALTVFAAKNGYVLSGIKLEYISKMGKPGKELAEYFSQKRGSFSHSCICFTKFAEDVPLSVVDKIKDNYRCYCRSIDLGLNGNIRASQVGSVSETYISGCNIYICEKDRDNWVTATPARVINYNIPKDQIYTWTHDDKEIKVIKKSLISKENRIKKDPYADIKYKPANPKSYDLDDVKAYSEAVEKTLKGEYKLLWGAVKEIKNGGYDRNDYTIDKLGLLADSPKDIALFPANSPELCKKLGIYRYCNCVFAESELLNPGELFKRVVVEVRNGDYGLLACKVKPLLSLMCSVDQTIVKSELLLLSMKA